MGTEPQKFGLWGGTQSGKTTYLAALKISAPTLNGKRTWEIRGGDTISGPWLIDVADNLCEKGLFPTATLDVQDFSFVIESMKNELNKTIQINLRAKDMPGEDFKKLHSYDPNNVLEYMAECKGLILFLKGNTTDWKLISLNIDAMKNRIDMLGGDSRKQKIAVCLAQYDDPALF